VVLHPAWSSSTKQDISNDTVPMMFQHDRAILWDRFLSIGVELRPVANLEGTFVEYWLRLIKKEILRCGLRLEHYILCHNHMTHPDPQRIQRCSPGRIKVYPAHRVADVVNNHISRSEIGNQMLLCPFENFINASVMKHNTVRWG
jgi:hypothetical protein